MWNARGLGCKRAILFLRQLVSNLRPLLLFICESKVSCKIARTWLADLHFDCVFGVDAKGSKGGLLLFWSNKINVLLRSCSSSHIDVNIIWESMCWRFTGCYAPAMPEERKAFWDLLAKFYRLRNGDNENWLIGGDFNEIMFESEKSGGINKRRMYAHGSFYNCSKAIKLKSVNTVGPKFTWTNKRKGGKQNLGKTRSIPCK